jgi:cation:H+ antiporter
VFVAVLPVSPQSTAHGDILRFGNAIGSNTLNAFYILGLSGLIQPISAANDRSVDLAVMVGTALLGLFLLWRRFVLNRVEGAVLVVGYIVYISSLLL